MAIITFCGVTRLKGNLKCISGVETITLGAQDKDIGAASQTLQGWVVQSWVKITQG